MNRRSFLGAMAKAPVVGTIAGRSIAEKAAADLANISVSGVWGGHAILESGGASESQWTRVFEDYLARAEFESLLYEQYRSVGRIDADLAVMKSFSLAAKITFQRQRLIRIEMDTRLNGTIWNRIQALTRRMIGLVG